MRFGSEKISTSHTDPKQILHSGIFFIPPKQKEQKKRKKRVRHQIKYHYSTNYVKNECVKIDESHKIRDWDSKSNKIPKTSHFLLNHHQIESIITVKGHNMKRFNIKMY